MLKDEVSPSSLCLHPGNDVLLQDLAVLDCNHLLLGIKEDGGMIFPVLAMMPMVMTDAGNFVLKTLGMSSLLQAIHLSFDQLSTSGQLSTSSHH